MFIQLNKLICLIKRRISRQSHKQCWPTDAKLINENYFMTPTQLKYLHDNAILITVPNMEFLKRNSVEICDYIPRDTKSSCCKYTSFILIDLNHFRFVSSINRIQSLVPPIFLFLIIIYQNRTYIAKSFFTPNSVSICKM